MINLHSFIKAKMLRISLMMLFSIVLFSAIPVHAHQGATGVIKQRMDMMDRIKKNMKEIKAMVQNSKPYAADKIAGHAEYILEIARKVKYSFPEGSLKHPSEALPSIWKNWQEFSSLAEQLTIESEKLKVAAKTQDQQSVKQQFAKLGKTCRSCHKDFRMKK